MNKVFNTPFEAGLRILLILYAVNNRQISITRIVSYDFISTYGRNFGLTEKNLHGSNPFSFSEFSSRRELCTQEVKLFVLRGLIKPNLTANGFLYSLTAEGKEYVNTLNSDYKNQYLDAVKHVINKYGRLSDEKLNRELSDYAVNSLGGSNE